MLTFTLCVAVVLLASPTGALSQPSPLRERALAPYRVGFEQMRAESFDEAAKSFSEAAQIDPSFEMAFYMLGRIHLTKKRFVEAVAALSEARRLYALDAGRHFTNAQEAQRHRRETIAEIDEYLRQLQSAPPTRQVVEQIRQLNERKRQLIDIASRGNNMTIDLAVPAYVSLSLGSAHFRSGKLPEAEKAYEEAVRADPRAGEAHNNLAVVYLETGRYREAERAVDAAEKAGFRVHPQLKADIQSKIKVRDTAGRHRHPGQDLPDHLVGRLLTERALTRHARSLERPVQVRGRKRLGEKFRAAGTLLRGVPITRHEDEAGRGRPGEG